MKSTQNITLALPKETLKRVKHLAVERDMSVSGLLKETLERLLEEDDSYRMARSRYSSQVAEGLDFGTMGVSSWSRDSLHER